MASDRTREQIQGALHAARKFIRGRHSTIPFGPMKLVEQLDAALALLDAFERETRLDEAGWWHNCPHDCEQFPERESCQRIIKLAAPPTPEVKK